MVSFMGLKHQTPQGMEKDTLWFNLIPGRSFKVLAVMVALDAIVYTFLKQVGLSLLGIILGAVVTIAVVAPTIIKRPVEEYIRGGGQYYDQLFIKFLYRKMNKVIYIRRWEEK